jgi:glycosyltransferase involved in cell wall biosynthesis
LKIYLANYEPTRQGGGWAWQRSFATGFKISSYDEADIFLIAGASMLSREEVQQAKADGKKIVLRVDNFLKNSRNRNTGMTRMKDFADWSDLIIYQSEWAKEFLSPFLGKDKKSAVILNSVDERIFNTENLTRGDSPVYLYSRYNRDESKNWPIAQYWFQKTHQENPEASLYITGNFSPELIENEFDFYAGENIKYFGILPPENMADIYRMSDYFIYPYFMDACSNTLIEALMCGCQIASVDFLLEGSAQEIMKKFNQDKTYFHLDRMINSYKEALNVL